MTLQCEEITAKGELTDFLGSKLREFNEAAIGKLQAEPIGYVFREDDEIVGGMFGWLRLGWLYLDMAWVHESHRGRGIGALLLEKMEHAARMRGVMRVRCETGSFQALPFYLKAGFEVYAENELTDPAGNEHREYLLRKLLA